VTGFDLAAALLDQARAKAEAEGLAIGWDLGSADSLPYGDDSFDVVSSCFGVIFVPDQQAAAAELARVCRSGGRLGVTSWRPYEGPHAIVERFSSSNSFAGADEWGLEERVEELLGSTFELEIEERTWHQRAESPDAMWSLMTEGAPPVKALVATLEPGPLEEFRQAMLEYWEGFRTNGGVEELRHYLVALGRRR
jgi:SAM-dependent methyltransferase